MASFFEKFKSKAGQGLHSRIAGSEELIRAAEGRLVAAKDSIELKKQKAQKLIEDANLLHVAHDELDELFEKFNVLVG